MGLPAVQQRVLDRMEGTLKASEPHLAAMFAIFARLSAGEPVGRESLAARRRRRWWLRPGAALSALVLVPVTFALILTGVLLGAPSHAGTCAVGMPAGRHRAPGEPVRVRGVRPDEPAVLVYRGRSGLQRARRGDRNGHDRPLRRLGPRRGGVLAVRGKQFRPVLI